MRPETISIIGGTGKMGSMFRNIFEKEGYKVVVSGKNTEISPEEAAAKGDVVIVTVPIRKTIETIKKIGPHVKKEALLTDFTSVKVEPVKVMLESSEADVIGGHPVFGPTVKLKGQYYVLCPARGERYLGWFKGFLEGRGCKVIIKTPEDHDKTMGIIQCLTHLSVIAMGGVLKSMNIDIGKTLELASPIYKMRIGIVGRILNQDPELYSDIQIYNSSSMEIGEEYKKSIEKLLKIIEARDLQAFDRFFKEAKEYLGDFCKQAQEESDYMLKKLAEREK